MAEKTDKLVCSICFSDFLDPKFIDCHHCFCLRCLEGYVETCTVGNHFPCPLCRRGSAVPAGGVKYFTTNFYIENSSTKVHSDFCSNHRQKTADVYCKDCAVVVCSTCIVKNHNRHQLLELTDEAYREELKTTKQDLISQNSKFQNLSDSVQVKVGEVAETTDRICSRVDDQIKKIYDELKSLGEKTKIQVNNWRDEETQKLISLNTAIQIERENVGDIFDNSDDVLENESFVQHIEILPGISEEQTKQNQRELDIPFVKSVKFVEGKLNSDILSHQIGILDRPSLEVGILDIPSLEVGHTSCFTTNFNVRQVKPDDVTWQAAGGDYVLPWTVGVRFSEEFGGQLRVYIKLDNITDKTIQHVDVKLRQKLINNNAYSQSVSKEYTNKISPGVRVDWCDLIDNKTINRQNGFLDSNNNFRIQTTITITSLSR